MIQNTSTSTEPTSSIKQAQEILSKSVSRFETTIENLSHKVGLTSQSIHRFLDMAEDHRAEFGKIKNRVIAIGLPLLPLLRQVGGLGRTVTQQAKANPKRYLWSFVGIAGAIVAWNYFEKETPRISS